MHSSLTKGSHSANLKKKKKRKGKRKIRKKRKTSVSKTFGKVTLESHSPLGPATCCQAVVGHTRPSVRLYCLLRMWQTGMRHSIFCQPAQERERTFLSPLNIMAGTRPARLLGQHDLQCEKGKPKSPSNENIKVNASQVRNLLPLTPINSYKTLVLSCPCTGTQTLDFIKLNFLFFSTRPVMCV